MAGSADARVMPLFPEDRNDESLTLADRETDELVLALSGPVGSGVSTTSAVIGSILRDTFGYEVHPVKISDLIAASASLVDVKLEGTETEDERVSKLQRAGTSLRHKFGVSYLAEKCVDHIAQHRVASGGYKKIGEELIPVYRRKAYIIDSLKHPSEVDVLKDVYGGIFWLFGVFAPEDVRSERLRAKGVTQAQTAKIFEIDEEEGVAHGQKVRDTIQRSDFFLRNDGQNQVRLKASLARYFNIIFGTEVITPADDEAAMYVAASSAAGSACLSRQVGAAIYSGGELLGKGRNDVPKAKGGLYGHADGEADHRCHKWLGNICHNDDRKNRLYGDVHKSLIRSGILQKGTPIQAVIDALKKTDIKNLIEYSRAVHAEMDAIMSVARTGNGKLHGATLYCTTFPCHNCARHIVASGIVRVVYIEPYPKSLALDLHKDAISIREDDPERVVFVQYEGVAPKNMLRLFEYRSSRKSDGKAVTTDPKVASPVSRSPLDGYYRREQIIVHRLQHIEGAVAAEKGVPDDGKDEKGPPA